MASSIEQQSVDSLAQIGKMSHVFDNLINFERSMPRSKQVRRTIGGTFPQGGVNFVVGGDLLLEDSANVSGGSSASGVTQAVLNMSQVGSVLHKLANTQNQKTKKRKRVNLQHLNPTNSAPVLEHTWRLPLWNNLRRRHIKRRQAQTSSSRTSQSIVKIFS